MNGWIKLHRKITEWEWYDDIKTFHLFIHLLLSANHETKKWHGVTVNVGQRITSYQHLAEETGLSVRSIRTAINKLKTTGELTYETTTKYGLVTIINWKQYQQTTGKLTVKRQSSDSQATTNKKDKNDNNIQTSPNGDSHMLKQYKEPVIDSDTGEFIEEPKKEKKKPTLISYPRCYEIWQGIAEQQEKSGVPEGSRLPYHQSFTFGFRKAYQVARKKGYGDAEIEHAVKVYASVLESPKSYWTKRYNFSEFMKYAYEKFIGKQPRDFAGKIK